MYHSNCPHEQSESWEYDNVPQNFNFLVLIDSEERVYKETQWKTTSDLPEVVIFHRANEEKVQSRSTKHANFFLGGERRRGAAHPSILPEGAVTPSESLFAMNNKLPSVFINFCVCVLCFFCSRSKLHLKLVVVYFWCLGKKVVLS